MPKIISIHEYELKKDVEPEIFHNVVTQAVNEGLFQLPGLEGYHFLMGIKGERTEAPAAIWVYENRKAWERLWGSPNEPIHPPDYPENWKKWEALLAPLLTTHPEVISYTVYETI